MASALHTLTAVSDGKLMAFTCICCRATLFQVPGVIDIFVREVVASNKKGQDMPCLLFLAGVWGCGHRRKVGRLGRVEYKQDWT